MRDTLPQQQPDRQECESVNLNTSHQPGSLWVAYNKNGKKRIYFDSFGQITSMEIQKYLKTKNDYELEKATIQRNTDSVQHINTHVCGRL